MNEEQQSAWERVVSDMRSKRNMLAVRVARLQDDWDAANGASKLNRRIAVETQLKKERRSLAHCEAILAADAELKGWRQHYELTSTA